MIPADPDDGSWRIPGRVTRPGTPLLGQLVATGEPGRVLRVAGYTDEADAVVVRETSKPGKPIAADRFPFDALSWSFERERWELVREQRALGV